MPWTLDLQGLLVVFVVALILGLGWTLGCWIMGQILARIFRKPNQP